MGDALSILPLVSVIIPVFNVAPYIEEALDSVVNQTYSNLEILIIDDGSTDESGEISDRYALTDSRIVVFHQRNKGLSAARNAGVDHAAGEVIAFLDSDDAYRIDAIETMLAEMKKHHADIVICDFSWHDTISHMTPVYTGHSSIVIDREEAFRRIADRRIDTAPWNRIYKRNIWNVIRFPEGRVCEGTYTVFDVFCKAERIAITNEKLIMHRRRPDSICNTFSLNNIEDFDYAMCHYQQFVKKYTPCIFSDEQLNSIRTRRIHCLITSYLKYTRMKPKDIEGRVSLRRILDQSIDAVGLVNCSVADRVLYLFSVLFPEMAAFSYCGLREAKILLKRLK